MSGASRVKSMNLTESDTRPVLGPAGNKAGTLCPRKPVAKPFRKVEKSPIDVNAMDEKREKKILMSPSKGASALSPKSHSLSVPSVLRRHEQLLQSNLSLNASCSSDASTDSFHSRASTGRLTRSNSLGIRRKQFFPKPRSVVSDGSLDSPPSDGSQTKKRCAWVTPNTGLIILLVISCCGLKLVSFVFAFNC